MKIVVVLYGYFYTNDKCNINFQFGCVVQCSNVQDNSVNSLFAKSLTLKGNELLDLIESIGSLWLWERLRSNRDRGYILIILLADQSLGKGTIDVWHNSWRKVGVLNLVFN